jgi:Protein of unknown function (DUF3570)
MQLMRSSLATMTSLVALCLAMGFALALMLGTASAGVLPEDRADVLMHRYDGGGITIQGPSVLVRKKLGDMVSLSGNYYIDSVTSASIDVVTQASPYKEKRTQYSLSADLLHGKTTYSGGYITSKENDYAAKTAYLSVSQDMFGDLTTVSFGFTRGWDKVGERGKPSRADPLERRNWSVGVSQVLTRNWLAGVNLESSESEGFLNNPYRTVRFRDASVRGYNRQLERYPHTRIGNAVSLQSKYYLPWRAAVDGNYRYYSDTWGIHGHTARIGYTQPWRNFTFEGHGRFYKQNRADFYSDLFPFRDAQNFLARDRELATFKSSSFGLTGTWQFHVARMGWMDKGTLNFSFDKFKFTYDDFRDLRVNAITAGTEPLYVLDANVMQFFISVWF